MARIWIMLSRCDGRRETDGRKTICTFSGRWYIRAERFVMDFFFQSKSDNSRSLLTRCRSFSQGAMTSGSESAFHRKELVP